jgi:uncharacterized protein
MRTLSAVVLHHRRLVIALALLGTILFAALASQLKSTMNVAAILPADDPEVMFFMETANRFGSNNINMAALETDDIFTQDGLNTLRAMTKAMGDVEGVKFAMSIANLPDMQPDGEGSISVRALVPSEGAPTDPAALDKIRRTVLDNDLLAGNLVSPDGKAALITAMLANDADRNAIGGALKEAVREAAGDHTFYFGGVEMIVDFLKGVIASPRMIVVMAATFGLFLLTMFLAIGTLRGFLGSLLVVGLATVWTLGALALADIELSLFTQLIPLLVIVLAAPFAVIVAKGFENAAGSPSEKAAAVLADFASPLAIAAAAVIAVSLSTLTTSLDIFRHTGVGVALGVGFAALFSLTLLPAVLAGTKSRAPKTTFADRLAKPSALVAFATHRAWLILALTVLLVVVAAFLATRMPRNVNAMATFPPGSEPRATEDLMQRGFGGSQLFMIDFESADVRRPAILEQMDIAAKRLRLVANVNYPQSIADVLKMLNRNLNNEPMHPDAMEKINNLWFMLEGQPQVDMLIDGEFGSGILQARIGDIVSDVVGPAIAEIKQVAGAVETRLVEVNVYARPPAETAKWARVLAERAALKVALDVQFHTGAKLNRVELADLLTPLRAAPPDLDVATRQELKQRYAAYFNSAESDIIMPAGFDVDGLAEKLSKLDATATATVVAALIEHLPESVLADDPEGPSYAAPTIIETYIKTLKNIRQVAAIAATAKYLKTDLAKPENAALLRDVASGLWSLNSQTAAVSAEAYQSITGEQPPAEAQVNIATHLTGWPYINDMIQQRLEPSLLQGLAVALVLLLLVVAIASRSAAVTAAATIATLAGLVTNFALMTLFGIPLDNIAWVVVLVSAGLILPSVIIQAAVYRGAAAKGAGKPLEQAVATTAGPLVAALLPVAIGFIVLAAAELSMQAQLGVFIAASCVIAGALALMFVPALIVAGGKKAAN